jgi:hypothetical protein
MAALNFRAYLKGERSARTTDMELVSGQSSGHYSQSGRAPPVQSLPDRQTEKNDSQNDNAKVSLLLVKILKELLVAHRAIDGKYGYGVSPADERDGPCCQASRYVANRKRSLSITFST